MNGVGGAGSSFTEMKNTGRGDICRVEAKRKPNVLCKMC